MNSYSYSTQAAVARDIQVDLPGVASFLGSVSAGQQIGLAVRPFHLEMCAVGAGLRATGDEAAVALAADIAQRLCEQVKGGAYLSEDLLRQTAASTVATALKHELSYRLTGLPHAVRPLSLNQVAFMNAMLFSDRALIFGVGPTGTGKTHLAIAAGLTLVAQGHFKSLKVTRPRVMLEGEVMTATLRAETAYDDQLTPIEDVLRDLIGRDEIKRQIEHGLIEIMPLGGLRGRTFNDSFVLIDEAQNMTRSKMRMALTRLGSRSRMVVTGDPAQIDLRGDEPSGLTHVLRLISGSDIALIHQFQNNQIVRNDLVARLETLYAQEDGSGLRAAA